MRYPGLNVLLHIILNSSQNYKVKLDYTHHSYLLTMIDVLIEHPHFPVLAWCTLCSSQEYDTQLNWVHKQEIESNSWKQSQIYWMNNLMRERLTDKVPGPRNYLISKGEAVLLKVSNISQHHNPGIYAPHLSAVSNLPGTAGHQKGKGGGIKGIQCSGGVKERKCCLNCSLLSLKLHFFSHTL